VVKNISEEQVVSPDFIAYAASIYKLMQPLNDFLNDLLKE
jgi:hypothetical protein